MNLAYKGISMRTVFVVVLALLLVACGSSGDKRVDAPDQDGDSIVDAKMSVGKALSTVLWKKLAVPCFLGRYRILCFRQAIIAWTQTQGSLWIA